MRYGLSRIRLLSFMRNTTLVVWFTAFVLGSIYNQAVLGQCNWDEVQKLLDSDGEAWDWFGYSVAISSDVAVIGVSGDDENGDESGSAYIYRWDSNGSGWIEEQKLLASDGMVYDNFGHSVAISGDVAVIGAQYNNNGNVAYSGSAYIFRWDPDGLVWKEEQNLLASDGAEFDKFGYSVAISGDVAVIGAYGDDDGGSYSGSAYIFRWDPDSLVWKEEQKLLASDSAADDRFGSSVSISGDLAVIGAFKNDDNGTDSGSAYIFRWDPDGLVWKEEQKLLASDGMAYDNFGYSVAISGDVAVIGAYLDDDMGDGSGSAYIFHYDGTNWNEMQKLLASDGMGRDVFGQFVSISGDVAVIGAPGKDGNVASSGSAYIYRWDPDDLVWKEEQKLLASDGATGDRFGISVSISEDRVVIGADLDDDNGTDSGSAYVFNLAPQLIITEQPQDLIIAPGSQACFSVIIDGGVGDITYQWRRDGFDLIDGGTISGSNTDTLCISSVWQGDEGLYDVVITDDCGLITSEPAELVVIDPPTLNVTATCPQGGAITINWSYAYPAGQIALLFAANTGHFTIPGSFQCAGTQLGLGNRAIQLGYKGYAGDDGSREVHASAGPNACGGYLQLIDLTTCVVSNVVKIE